MPLTGSQPSLWASPGGPGSLPGKVKTQQNSLFPTIHWATSQWDTERVCVRENMQREGWQSLL